MDTFTKYRYEARAAILKALGHPSRLLIVDELGKGERCVCELTALVGADMSTVSKHLSILKSVGLVRDDKRGNSVYYSLMMPCVKDFLGCIEEILKQKTQTEIEAFIKKGTT